MAAPLGPYEYVVGSTRVDFYLTFTDEFDVPINITNPQAVKVQGSSDDLPNKDIDLTGTVHSAADGIAKFAEFGNAITANDLGVLPSATYTLRGYLRDNGGKITYTPQTFQVRWVHQPI